MSLLILGALATLHLVGATTYTSYRLAWVLLGTCSPLIRMAATITIGVWLASTGFHLLFALSLFQLPVAAAAAFGLAFAASFFPRNRSTRSLIEEDWERLRTEWGDALAPAERLSLYVAVPTACLVLVRGLVLPPLGWDWLTYHGLRSARFVQESGWTFPLAPGPWNKYRHFLAGAEVLDAWAMLPFHSDLLVNLCTGIQWLALGISAAALAEVLGVRLRRAIISGVAVLFIPTAVALALSGYVENALSASLVLAIAFAILYARTAQPAYALLTFAAGGLAIGIKLHGGLPSAVAFLTVTMLVLCSPRHRASALLVLPAGLLAAMLPPLPWLWIAYRDTGYPLSPMPVTVFRFRLGISNVEMELDLARDLSAAYTFRGELDVLTHVFNYWPDRYALGPLSLLPLFLVPVACLRLLRRRDWLTLLIPTAAMAAVLASYYHPGMSVIRLYWSGNTSRFLISLLALAIPFSFLAFSESGRFASAYVWVVGGSVFFHAAWIALWGTADFEGLALLQTATLLILSSAAVLFALRWQPRAGKLVAAVVFCATIVGVDYLQRYRRPDAWALSVALHPTPRYWHAAAVGLDQRAARRVAVTSGHNPLSDHWFTYPLLGRRLQNELIYVAAEGGREFWIDRVLASGATDVVSFLPVSPELSWMEERPDLFRRRAGDSRWGWFEIQRFSNQ